MKALPWWMGTAWMVSCRDYIDFKHHSGNVLYLTRIFTTSWGLKKITASYYKWFSNLIFNSLQNSYIPVAEELPISSGSGLFHETKWLSYWSQPLRTSRKSTNLVLFLFHIDHIAIHFFRATVSKVLRCWVQQPTSLVRFMGHIRIQTQGNLGLFGVHGMASQKERS